MAKRKTSPAAHRDRETDGDTPPTAKALNLVCDEYFNKASSKTGDSGMYLNDREAEHVVIGIPLRPWSLQWFFHNDGFPLGRMTLCVGESGSCKSAFLFENGRWHLEPYPDSIVRYNLTESRDTPILRTSIIGEDLIDRVMVKKCRTIEEWQIGSTEMLTFLEDTFKGTEGPTAPLAIQTDSISGVTSQNTVDKIAESGHATLTHAQDANLINLYTKFVFPVVDDWPVTWIASNHVKFVSEQVGRFTVKKPKIPGGDALRFHSTFIIMFTYVRDLINRPEFHGGNVIRMYTDKNSLGEKHKGIEVDMGWMYQPIEGSDQKRQITIWDWDSTSVRLLRDHLNDTEAYPDLADIVQFGRFSVEGRTATCPTLGITKSVSWTELGLAISNDEKTMNALRSYYGIHKVTPFRSGVPWQQQKRDARAAGQIRTAPTPDDS